MKKHNIEVFEFPSLTIFCYGESCAVNMLIQYFKTNTAGGKTNGYQPLPATIRCRWR